MNRPASSLRLIPVLALAAMAGFPRAALGCATCFGASDSKLAQGMNMGIVALLFVILGVLAMVGLFFVHVARRARSVASDDDAHDGSAVS